MVISAKPPLPLTASNGFIECPLATGIPDGYGTVACT